MTELYNGLRGRRQMRCRGPGVQQIIDVLMNWAALAGKAGQRYPNHPQPRGSD